MANRQLLIFIDLGLAPQEDSSGNRRRLGHISKQGNSILRFLLVEAAQVTLRSLPEWREQYFHLMMRRGRKIAKTAMGQRRHCQRGNLSTLTVRGLLEVRYFGSSLSK